MKVGILHTAFIGDVILSGLLVEALFTAGHEIIYFTKKNTSLIFSHDVRVKKVVEIHKGKGLAKIFAPQKIAKQIDDQELDILLVPHRSATSSLCASFSKVKLTIGFHNAALSFLLKKRVFFRKNVHECLRYLDLLNPSIVNEEIKKRCIKLARPVLKYSEADYLLFNKKFSSTQFQHAYTKQAVSFLEMQKNFFILATGSVWKTKKYPLAHWVEVAFQFLLKYPHYYCVLTGSQVDKADIDSFIHLFTEKCRSYSGAEALISKVLSAANLFSLFEFALFTSTAKFVLSNDSSPVHFASAFNIPVIAIFGPTVTEFGFAPSSEQSISISYADQAGQRLSCQPCSIHGQNVCPKGHFKCMKELKPTSVMKAIENLLA